MTLAPDRFLPASRRPATGLRCFGRKRAGAAAGHQGPNNGRNPPCQRACAPASAVRAACQKPSRGRDDRAPACGPTFAYRCGPGAVTSTTPFPGGIRHHSPIRGTPGGNDTKSRGLPAWAGALRPTPRPAEAVRSMGPSRHGPSCIGLSTKVPCHTRLRVQEVPRLSVEAWCGVLGHRLFHHEDMSIRLSGSACQGGVNRESKRWRRRYKKRRRSGPGLLR
jgi:hypothetical protein